MYKCKFKLGQEVKIIHKNRIYGVMQCPVCKGEPIRKIGKVEYICSRCGGGGLIDRYRSTTVRMTGIIKSITITNQLNPKRVCITYDTMVNGCMNSITEHDLLAMQK